MLLLEQHDAQLECENEVARALLSFKREIQLSKFEQRNQSITSFKLPKCLCQSVHKLFPRAKSEVGAA